MLVDATSGNWQALFAVLKADASAASSGVDAVDVTKEKDQASALI
ncbi:hypothetical protein [Rhodanobacter sp. L36]|nr:hypothetical protein [Rhodanobacter sp. L36]